MISEYKPNRATIEIGRGERFLDVSLSSIRQPDRTGDRVLVLRDITAVKQHERRLQDTEALLRGILERSSNGIVRLRPIRDEAGEVAGCPRTKGMTR